MYGITPKDVGKGAHPSIRNILNFLGTLSTRFHTAFIRRSDSDQMRTCTFPAKLADDWKGGNRGGTKGRKLVNVGRVLRTMIRGMRNMSSLGLKEQGVENIVHSISITLITGVIQRN